MLPAIRKTARVEQITKFHDNLQRFIDKFGDIPELKMVRKIQSHIDRGHLVFELSQALELAGIRGGLPALAVSPVGKKSYAFQRWDGLYLADHWELYRGKWKYQYKKKWSLSIKRRENPFREETRYEAEQPLIPTSIETNKDSWVMWPAVWKNKTVIDPDPVIIEPIVGDYWAVTAAWDYTPEELEMLEQLRRL